MSDLPTDIAPDAEGAADAGSDAQPMEPPLDHECPENPDADVIAKGDVSAASRGWGPGWPNDNRPLMTTVRAAGIALSVRTEVAPIIEWLVNQTVVQGYGLHEGECWGFANRAIRGTDRPSNHSWGLAVDLNAPANPMGSSLVTDMPGSMVELWKARMFRWGGDYNGRKDAMHYEFMGTPDDAARIASELGAGSGAPPRPPPPPSPPPPAAPPDRPLLARQAAGADVRILQERLVANGARLAVDAVFGPATEQARPSGV